jgi:ATP-dependent DNA helicase RecG
MDDERKLRQLNHLAALGRLLSAEEKADFDGSAVPEGLGTYLRDWLRQGRDLGLPLDLLGSLADQLSNYSLLVREARRSRVPRALTALREEYRALRDGPAREDAGPPADAPARAKRKTAATAQPSPEKQPASTTALSKKQPVSARASSKKQPDARPSTRRAPAPPQGVTLDTPLERAPGVRFDHLRSLKKLGLETIRDLLYHFPRRYDDFTSMQPIHALMYGSTETIVATVDHVEQRRSAGGMNIVTVRARDDTGAIEAVWFNQPYLAKSLRVGMRIVLSGRVGQYRGRLTMESPEWEPYDDELIHTGRLVPVYPLSGKLRPRGMRRLVKRTVDTWAGRIPDPVPPEVRKRADLWDLARALRQVHFPDDPEHLALARRRLAFDEFLLIQLGVLQRKREWQAEPGQPLPTDRDLLTRFLANLPFVLTGAQQRVMEQLLADIAQPVPMSRLLQGDVGSGKTVVAAAAMLMAVANGKQAAIMAPTEILAEQHERTIRQLVAGLEVAGRPSASVVTTVGEEWKEEDPERARRVAELKKMVGAAEEKPPAGAVRVALLTGSLKARQKRELRQAIADGQVDIVVGTHALIQEDVAFAGLGMVVIDEQHRFGVLQRQALHQKGFNPHLLVMTATPIPRTLALTLHGDLDLGTIDEMPPGRQPIRTRWLANAERQRAYDFIREQVAQGRQAFVICPLVEESEKIEAAAAVEEFHRLQNEVFSDLKLDLLHGRMSGAEKERIMRSFRDGETQVLVSTPVVEVGIDVPNATVMMVEGAERFGLSQLHQFRGRVGRGEHASYCILLATSDELGSERLKAIEETEDGFALAEIDLELRGPGEFFGTRQSGMPDLKVARLGDTRLLELARREAEAILAEDSNLSRPEHRALAERVTAFWSQGMEVS